MRRCLTPLVMLAAILMPAARPSPVRAGVILSNAGDGTPVYSLNNTDPAGTAPVPGFLAYVKPPGTLDLDESPLTILPGSSGFTLFGDNNDSLFKVAVGDGKVPEGQPNAGDPYQLLAVDFGADGFAPGGVLNFSLTLNDPAQQAPELLLLPTPPDGLGTDPDEDEEPTTPTTPPTGNGQAETPPMQIPEPISVVIWSVLAGLGFARARGLRRSGPPPA